MAILNGAMIRTVFLVLILSGTLTAAIECNEKTCSYLTVIAGIKYQLFQSYGYSQFQECTCNRFGYSLPSTTPSTPITSCGRSAVAGGASSYLNRPSGRIVGGKEVSRECQYPWQVSIRTSLGNICGGTIVDNKHIITAADCTFFTTEVSQMIVGVGSSTIARLTYYRVSKIDRHPLYDPSSKGNNIAVITLTEELDFSVCVQPACLPSSSLNISTGVRCLASGWGITSVDGSRQKPAILQEAIIPILNQASCSSYGTIMDETKICAGYLEGGIDACVGDAGGPLMCAEGELWVLAGVISFGKGCAEPGFPGVYTNVFNSFGWLQTVLI